MLKHIRLPLIFFGLIVISMTACGTSSSADRPAAQIDPNVATTIEPIITPTPEPTSTPTIIPLTMTPSSNFASGPKKPADVTVCASGCDFKTVQEAIDNPNTGSGTVIEIFETVHTEGGIEVSKDVTIRGMGPELTTIQAHPDLKQATKRVFFIPVDTTVVISELTIQHGNPQPDKYFRSGGGIANLGTLTVENCVIQRNTANDGGGIWSRQGELRVINSTIRDNIADRKAIEEDFVIPNYSSTFACGSGGGIKLVRGGDLYLLNSTINNNIAMSHGGGAFVACSTNATLMNSTISGNQATTWGGGIYVKGVVNLSHCTIVNNNAKAVCASGQQAARCPKGEGGNGVFIRGIMNFSNSLILNKGSNDCILGKAGEYGTLEDGKIGESLNNFVGDGSCDADYFGDPMLEPLADNCGYTETHAILNGSPLIDAVEEPFCPVALDQRGYPRGKSNEESKAFCDIGAFEYQDLK